MDRKKILVLIFDGLGDRPISELGRQTPLQAARKENLDWFAPLDAFNSLPEHPNGGR